MPLKPGSSKATVSGNIAELMHTGRPQKQAAAIALDNVRRHPRKASGGGILPGWRPSAILPPETAKKHPELTEGPQEYTGAILPFRRDIGGNLHWAVPGIVQSGIAAFTLPGDVYAGKVSPTSDEGIARATDLAGFLTLGGGATAPAREAGQLGIFGGRLAKTADMDALRTAETMAAQGSDRTTIWKATGWFQGVDGQWRFEIPDDAARWVIAPGDWATEGANGRLMAPSVGEGVKKALDKNVPPGAPMRVRNLLEHGPLEDAYPPVANTKLLLKRQGRGSTYTMDDGAQAIGLNEYLFPDEAKSVLLHELQHRVQAVENTAPGGSPINLWNHSDKAIRDAVLKEWNRLLTPMRFDDYAATASMKGLPLSQIKESYSDYLKSVKSSRADMYSMVNKAAQETAAEIVYRRLSGEVEARNVQARSRMTPGERRLTPPWETQDTPDADQIVRWPERMAKGGAVHLRAGEQADIRHGMIKSSVPGRTDQLPVAVPRDSYIVPADVVSGLGQGNSDAGADILEQILEQKLGGARGASGQPAPDIDIVAAGGEFVIGPDAVKSIGGGDARKGHATLDRMVLGVRKQVAKRLTKLAPPKT